jgi:hypothetical protein
MACACGVDFEGDQWTFFKPPPEDLLRLHGIDVHEMQLYRPIVDHVTDQLQAGRTMTVEVDSFYLPDTEGSAYRKAHVKSSIAIEGIGTEGERLRYFHGAGYYELHGEDYCGIFRLGRTFSEDILPPYVELIDFHAGAGLRDEALRRGALASLQRVVSHRNRNNPWLAFGERLVSDLPKLRDRISRLRFCDGAAVWRGIRDREEFPRVAGAVIACGNNGCRRAGPSGHWRENTAV